MFVINLGPCALQISTLFINLTGSLLIGYLVGMWGNNSAMPADKWHFWSLVLRRLYYFFVVQLAGLDLVRLGNGTKAGIYAASSIALGLVAVWIGLSFAHRRAA